MTMSQKNVYILRDGIMNLLSDEEVATVSTVESTESLADGDEYIDLEQLDQGVRRAQAAPTPMGRVLPRKAVRQDTWSKILMRLTRLDANKAESSQPTPTPRAT